jgi:hypothetical protein
MPKIPHIIGWAMILLGAAIYVYEANNYGGTGVENPTLASIESVIPGNIGLDLPLLLGGAAIVTLG